MSGSQRQRWLAVLVGGSLLVAGCGSGESTSSTTAGVDIDRRLDETSTDTTMPPTANTSSGTDARRDNAGRCGVGLPLPDRGRRRARRVRQCGRPGAACR